MSSLLAKFMESLNVRFYRSSFREVIKPAYISGSVEEKNVIIHLNKGHLYVGKKSTPMKENTFYFFPHGQEVFVKHGYAKQYTDLGSEGFRDDEHRKLFMRNLDVKESFDKMKEVFTIVGFDVLLYNAISFFKIIEMPVFPMPHDIEFEYLIRHIVMEEHQRKLGRETIVSNYMEEIVIHLCRYIDTQPKLKQYIEKLEYLTDKRLVDIVHYIQENLEKDLSNKAIARVAFVAEDYVGQFFKSLTDRNLQDYIESQRLERALQLLKALPDSIQEISYKVGFKDPAYFSRRFKVKFGYNAHVVRDNKSHVV